ncbi:MAG: protein kinase [Myxococcota bacterium]|nr:protein kinase [Myxococcota bacterium]
MAERKEDDTRLETQRADRTKVVLMTPPHRRPGSPDAGTPGDRTALLADATAVLAPGQAFPLLDESGSVGRRTKGDSAPPLDFSRNTTIGRFELIRELARGGMGQVFLGRDTKLGRKVAIKFLLRSDAHFVQRFLVEARATAACTHENIVTIFEVGEHEGLPYMVLEYLEGKTLTEVLDAKPSTRQFVELMVPVARALERAHEHGIVHRDLKPNNIFVTDRGQVKVLDFGVARLIDRADDAIERATASLGSLPQSEDRSYVTFGGSNSLVGTLPYMSPEQWGADEVNHQSDLWAFGIICWRALTGVHPVGTTAPEKLRERLCDLATPLPSIGLRDPTIPNALVAIIDRCVAKRRADRYANASELLADLQAFITPRADRTTGEVCPYRGLAAFAEDDAEYFFGRSNEIRTALSQLDGWPLLAVIGPSGVGKSSFVHAGLVPAVRAGGGNWQVRVLRPGRLPLHRLAAVLDESLATGESADDLLARLVEAPGVFGATLRAAAARRNENILVVVDQLEELFTLCDSDKLRRLFLAALLAAADDPSSPVRVVLSMRADFLDRLAGHKHFLSELSRGLFFLTAPDQDNLRETLVRPAELAGYAFENPEIIEDMMQAATSRGALPLLSFAAMRLWDARDRPRKLLTLTAYQAMGGVGGAFARHADQVASAVPPQSQILLRAIMTRLVTPEGTRAVVDHSELLSLANDPEDVERILDQLVRARLIHLQTDQDQVATVEIVHEMLITEWPTLQRWLDDSQAIRGFLHELRQAANQWSSHNKSSDLVWRGTTAQEALGHAKRHVLDLSALERAYLSAVKQQAARSRRRKVLAVGSILTALGLVLAGGSVAVVRITLAEQEARENLTEAHRSRDQAELQRERAEAAKADLQKQYDIIAEKERQRQAAEQLAAAAEQLAVAANRSEEMTKEQLADANRALERQVAEAQAAKDRAQNNAALAQNNAALATKASLEARAAQREVERLLEAKRAEVERLKAAAKDIYSGDLSKPKGDP